MLKPLVDRFLLYIYFKLSQWAMTFETEANQNCSNLVHDLEMTSLVNDFCEEIRCNSIRSKITTFCRKLWILSYNKLQDVYHRGWMSHLLLNRFRNNNKSREAIIYSDFIIIGVCWIVKNNSVVEVNWTTIITYNSCSYSIECAYY